ncbi:hypothetical protein GWI33_007961 [Rhynchophorus ferrugineus]|uniref:Uncharacterized protein n=1 Tax=Rhynchophorus ferrugineus TaxID=354439 RepID=A0A834IDG6_RHYFE|nr:hypothetical protein GWI33_007961 [Rhynchophorus ferrugineus]
MTLFVLRPTLILRSTPLFNFSSGSRIICRTHFGPGDDDDDENATTASIFLGRNGLFAMVALFTSRQFRVAPASAHVRRRAILSLSLLRRPVTEMQPKFWRVPPRHRTRSVPPPPRCRFYSVALMQQNRCKMRNSSFTAVEIIDFSMRR